MFEEVDNKNQQGSAAPANNLPTPEPPKKKEAPAPDQKQDQAPAQDNIHTMPMDYYMGDKTKQSVKQGQAQAQPSPMQPYQPAAAPQATGGKKKTVLNIVIVVVLVLVVGISAYLLYASYQNVGDDEPTTPVVQQPVTDVVTEPAPVEEVAPDVEIDEEEAPDVEIEEEATVMFDPSDLNQVSLSLLASKDTDKDGLTDAEETIIGTNINKNDTDNDTYRDGQEIEYYYSPLQPGSVRLNEMNFVEVYENNPYGYKILYPSEWMISPLDEDNPRDVMITSEGNEFINIFVNTKPAQQSLEDWYLQKAPEVAVTELKKYDNYNELAVVESPDGFTVYIENKTDVYIINYNIGLSDEASYPSLFAMIVNSFELTEKKPLEKKATIKPLADYLGLSGSIVDNAIISGDCASAECIEELFSSCATGLVEVSFGEMNTVALDMQGEGDDGCNYSLSFMKADNDMYANKAMSCMFYPQTSLEASLSEQSCEGELADLMNE